MAYGGLWTQVHLEIAIALSVGGTLGRRLRGPTRTPWAPNPRPGIGDPPEADDPRPVGDPSLPGHRALTRFSPLVLLDGRKTRVA